MLGNLKGKKLLSFFLRGHSVNFVTSFNLIFSNIIIYQLRKYETYFDYIKEKIVEIS